MKVLNNQNKYEIRVHHSKEKNEDFYLQFVDFIKVFDSEGTDLESIQITEMTSNEDSIQFSGESENFQINSVWKRETYSQSIAAEVNLTYIGTEKKSLGLTIMSELRGKGRPDWMIPGTFYKENRFKHNLRPYPRYDFEGGNPSEMVSDFWSFRADRASLPVVFAWNEGICGGLCVDEVSQLGINGLGFSGNTDGTKIWINFPYREEPVTFIGNAQPAPQDICTHVFEPGEEVKISWRIYTSSADPHAYNDFVRYMYDIHREEHRLNPWVGLEAAADLTSHGLYHWHYNKEHQILNETAAFDREFNNNVNGMGDRPHMHVGWVSGAPYVHALITYGRKHNIQEYVDAGVAVLDKIACGLAPNGTFWASYVAGKGWTAGWNPKKTWLQARTISEATLFMIRALEAEKKEGYSHENWEKAVLSNLNFAVGCQREDGNFGSYYCCNTGNVEEWDGAGGMLWIAALLEGAKYFSNDELNQAAVRAGNYYEKFILDEYIYGAPEDVHLTPTSEDAYNAVISYVLLYEFDQNEKWLSLARSSADWMMTFRWSYNLEFPKNSLLKQYDYCSRGADQASTSNQHLHNYGLICAPEVLRLWKYTNDDYYLNRTRDNLACFLQFIAREDGDFNAYKGMVTERFYNTNCFQPKGMMLTLSHSWCVGMILLAVQETQTFAHELGLEELIVE